MTEHEDTCRPVDIDGETIRVHGSGEMSDESREALGALIRAAKKKFADEHPPVEVTDPERRERYAETLYGTLEVSPRRHPWATLSPLRRAVWYARADAAMRLADAELAAVVVRVPDTSHTAREQLLDALDFSYCLGLGFETPEMLLAAYDASRTVPPTAADRAAVLREAEAALRAEAKRLTGEFNDSDILHEDGPASAVATWKRAADLLRRMAAVPAAVSDRTDGETRDDCCGAEPPVADGWVGDCWCTLPPGHSSKHRCEPCAERHGAPDWTDLPAVGGAHSCRNCAGINPDTCLMNPDRPKPVPVHAVPLPGSNGISSCCGRPPCEFVGERVTRNPDEVTCPAAPAVGGAQPKEA
jgi:hypothetical protein